MKDSFDSFASQYSESIKELPKSYINMIVDVFGLKSFSKVIDLGCGSGVLTLPLANFSSFVSGLDISHNMIEIARERSRNTAIKWIEEDVELFDFQGKDYDLIVSYESIHLFPNTKKLLQRCERGLKVGGAICMGWCFYNWELLLEDEIVTTFNNHGIVWGEWSYQKFDKFKNIIDSGEIEGLTPTKSAHIGIYEEWSVCEIVKYITSISKALSLTENEQEIIREELTDLINKKYGNRIKGNTEFWIRYSEKR